MVQLPSDPQSPQNIAVVLQIGNGSFADGFAVTIRIIEDGQLVQEHHDLLNIPAAAEMSRLYDEWHGISLENSRILQAVPAQVTNVATLEDWRQRTDRLEDYCKRWFQESAFGSLRDRIRANTRARNEQSVPIIVNCMTGDVGQNELLRRLPWHLWDLISRHNVEFALFTKFHHRANPLASHIRVLAIFGSAQGGLQLDQDAAALQILQERGAQIIWRSEPSQKELTDLLHDEAWDILFFAGHSSSEGASGSIQLRETVNLPLSKLHNGLRDAVKQGLKLAIFNSCDGLGIADFLTELEVPAMIVMRQPVPDPIACQFLLHFLTKFSQGKPLCRAVREARDRLESVQSEFPGASWLPTLCQNPNQPQLVWAAPQPPAAPRRSPRLRRIPYLLIGSIALAGTIAAATVAQHRCQIFPSLCATTTSAKIPVDPFISDGRQFIKGSKVALSEPYRSLKKQGIEFFSQGQYDNAVTIFDALRNQAKQNRNAPNPNVSKAALAALQDPEVLIYRNNAWVNTRYAQNPTVPIHTIAVAAPLNLDAGLQIILGVAQAQDVAVQQDTNLQVVIANDNNIPSQASQIAESLANDTKILAVIGHYTSPNTCAALKIYSPNHLVIVSPTSTVVNLQSNLDCGGDPNKVFFRTVSTSRVEASSLVRYLIDDLKKPRPKVAIFYNSQESFSQDLFDQFVQVLKAFNGSVVATIDLSASNFDVNHLPPQVKDADALAVLPDGQTDNGKNFERAIEIIKLNNGNKPVLGANTLYLQEVLTQIKNGIVNRLFLAVDWYPTQCGAEKFAKQVNEYWGGDLNRRTALSYEAVQAVLQTLDSQATRLSIQQKLSETGIRAEMGVTSRSATIEGQSISFDVRGDRREITTRAIVTVNDRLRFSLVKDVPCPK